MAAVSCCPVTEGTVTMGMFGPLLTTRSTAEFFDTDAPAFGFGRHDDALGRCAGLGSWWCPRVRLSFFSVWVATVWGSPTTLGTVTLPPNTERRRKKAMTPSATSSSDEEDDEAPRSVSCARASSRWRGGRRRAAEDRPWCGRSSAGTAWVAPTAAAIIEVDAGVARLDGSPLGEAQEVRPQLLGRPVAVVGVLGHRLHHDGLERRRHRRVDLAGQDGRVAHVLGRHRHRRVAGEGRPAHRHLVEDDAERVDVAAGVDPLALGLLG